MNPTPQQIKEARLAAGPKHLTQAAAAKMCRVTTAGYKHWEGGVRKMSQSTWELFQIRIKEREDEQSNN